MHQVTLIRGDGTGPEIVDAALNVIEATGVKINWEEAVAGETALEKCGTALPEETLLSLRKTRVGLKGPRLRPSARLSQINVALRRELDLYVNLRPAKSYPGVNSLYQDIDLIVVRENTEDLYSGVEHRVGADAAESIKIITRSASERIVRYAFEYARRESRRKVTVVHKANILKLSDGLFLEAARSVAAGYPDIEFEERIVDNMAMQLVQKPHFYDLMVMPNLYGDILSDLCAGLVGGLGLAPSANIGDEIALFEPYTAAPQIPWARQGQSHGDDPDGGADDAPSGRGGCRRPDRKGCSGGAPRGGNPDLRSGGRSRDCGDGLGYRRESARIARKNRSPALITGRRGPVFMETISLTVFFPVRGCVSPGRRLLAFPGHFHARLAGYLLAKLLLLPGVHVSFLLTSPVVLFRHYFPSLLAS